MYPIDGSMSVVALSPALRFLEDVAVWICEIALGLRFGFAARGCPFAARRSRIWLRLRSPPNYVRLFGIGDEQQQNQREP
jgi:hypothetical protein